MARVELPNEQWADLKDATTIRKRDRDRVLTAMDGIDGNMARSIRSSDMLLALAVEKWSLDVPLPSENLEVLDDLDIPTYDMLLAAVAPWQEALFPDFSLKIKDGALVEGSPT